MTVHIIARDLYHLIGKAEKLNKEIQSASPAHREELLEQLRKVKAERDHLRRALDGSKDRT